MRVSNFKVHEVACGHAYIELLRTCNTEWFT